MFQQIFENRKLKEIAGIVILLNYIVLVLALSMIYMNSRAIKDVHKEIVELKTKVAEEIKLRDQKKADRSSLP